MLRAGFLSLSILLAGCPVEESDDDDDSAAPDPVHEYPLDDLLRMNHFQASARPKRWRIPQSSGRRPVDPLAG